MKKVVSFSFGQTSGFMLRKLMDAFAATFDKEFLVVFENTGREHPETLKFGRAVAEKWGVRIVLLEYCRVPATTIPIERMRPGPARKNLAERQASGETIHWFKEAGFDSLAQIGDKEVPFDRLLNWMTVLPNVVARACSKHLKQEVLFHYLWSNGIFEWEEFIGIRNDEAHRALEIIAKSPSYRHTKFPLIDDKITKADVDKWWNAQTFKLNIPNHMGNCDGCFLKKRWKLEKVAKAAPKDFKWWIDWEARKQDKGQGGRFNQAYSYQKLLNFSKHEELDLGDRTDESGDIACSCAVADATCAEEL